MLSGDTPLASHHAPGLSQCPVRTVPPVFAVSRLLSHHFSCKCFVKKAVWASDVGSQPGRKLEGLGLLVGAPAQAAGSRHGLSASLSCRPPRQGDHGEAPERPPTLGENAHGQNWGHVGHGEEPVFGSHLPSHPGARPGGTLGDSWLSPPPSTSPGLTGGCGSTPLLGSQQPLKPLAWHGVWRARWGTDPTTCCPDVTVGAHQPHVHPAPRGLRDSQGPPTAPQEAPTCGALL